MNTENYEPTPELKRLLSELLDGQLTEEDRIRLSDALRNDLAAQGFYRRVISVHALLQLDFGLGYQHLLPPMTGDNCVISPVTPNQFEYTPHGQKYLAWPLALRRKGFRRICVVAASMAAGLLIFILWPGDLGRGVRDWTYNTGQTHHSDEHFTNREPRTVAILSQATGVIWEDEKLPTDVGAPLSARAFKLKQGLVQIEFFSGASVVIEAPAQFEISSANHVMCSLGKIRAFVPSQARGFKIDTPTYTAVDLGTEFTVHVDGAGQSEFHVLDGEVELWDRDRGRGVPAERLTVGEGATASPSGVLKADVTNLSGFVGRRELLQITEQADQERFQHWQHASQEWQTAPNVLLYFGFEGHDPWERVLHNEGPSVSEKFDGAIVGCQWTSGRWGNKHALEFKRTGDRVRISVPGEFESLTFVTWVRIEGFERWLSSLMLTDGHDLGEVHWQLTEKGQIMLGVKAEPDQSHDYYSPSVITPVSLGRWVHLATVFNGKAGYVSHYIDGTEVSRESIRKPTVLRIDSAEIGNWVAEDFLDHRIRSLNGRMDEFILFGAPLTKEKIRQMYESGKPQSLFVQTP